MDLTALLAREGIEAGDTDALVNLVSWARHRAAALVAHIEPGSPLAEALGAALVQAQGSGTPVPRPQPSSAPRPVARAVSKPYLGAAVQAALSGKQEDLELAIETAAADAHTTHDTADQVDDFEPPVLGDSPAPAPDPEPELDDNDPSIGGFNRFAFSFRRRAAEKQALEDSRPAMTLSRDFEHQAEANTRSGEWNVDVLELPEPPTFEVKMSSRRRPGLDPNDAEPSGLLVLGIPDEEGIDIPILRPRPRSTSFDARPEGSAPHGAPPPQPMQPEAREPSRPQLAAEPPPGEPPDQPASTSQLSPLLDDEDSFDLGLDNLEADPVAASPQTEAQPETPRPVSAPQTQASRPASGPQLSPMPRQDSAPRVLGSGPHGPPPPPPPRPDSTPSPSASAKKTQSLRALPPPPPREGKRGTKPPPPPAAAKPTPAPKRGKRAKVVELGEPVTRPNSAPFAAAAPSERSGQRPIPADDEVMANPRHLVPDYLRDDDE